MLTGKRVLCSPANEYYAHRLTSIMLTGKRVLCSLANEYYAPFREALVALAFPALSQTFFPYELER